jgi:hypothetical protein
MRPKRFPSSSASEGAEVHRDHGVDLDAVDPVAAQEEVAPERPGDRSEENVVHRGCCQCWFEKQPERPSGRTAKRPEVD